MKMAMKCQPFFSVCNNMLNMRKGFVCMCVTFNSNGEENMCLLWPYSLMADSVYSMAVNNVA
jgi:hypothetical protein